MKNDKQRHDTKSGLIEDMDVNYSIPDWAKPSFEARFHEHMRAIQQLPEVSSARLQQISLQGKWQEAIPPELYPLLLEYEGAINARTSLEHQYLYWSGIRDGLKLSELYRRYSTCHE